MPQILVTNIIQSDKAKTIEHALAIVQTVRATVQKTEGLVLDFSGITWITSMFADRLVKALVTFYGDNFEKYLQVIGIEKTNVMFHSLWESAINKFHMAEA